MFSINDLVCQIRRWTVAPIVALVFLVAGPAFATESLDRFLTCNDQGLYKQAQRRMAAGNIAEVFILLADRIPAVTDAEKAWLKAEIDDTKAASGQKYTKRSLMAERSIPYAKREAALTTRRIIDITTDIRDNPKLPGDEMRAWMDLNGVLFSFNYRDQVAMMVEAGIVGQENVPVLIVKPDFEANNKAYIHCLVYNIVNELPAR